MKYLFSRFGGSTFIIGKGRASAENLPDDQSLDNLLDNFATEISHNILYLSSYDACPEFMGSYPTLPKGAVKIGTIEHEFFEVFTQYDIQVTSDVYIFNHEYKNVFGIIIKTYGSYLVDVFDGYQATYDYVQTTFFRELEQDDLKLNPKLMEIILIILLFKMGIHQTDFKFTASKTFLGKRISTDYIDRLNDTCQAIESEEDLAEQINKYQ
jgi:hypothetical protein